MFIRKSVVTLLLVLGSSVACMAADECSAILQYGIWESRSVSSDVVESQDYATWACSAKAQHSQTGIGLNIPNYGDFFGNTASSSSANDCSSSNGNFKLSSNYKEQTRTAAVALASAWQACIDRLGSHASVRYRSDPKLFTMQLIRRVDSGAATAHARIRAAPANSITCTTSAAELEKGVAFEKDIDISCQRSDITQGVSIDIYFTPGGGSSVYVPAVQVTVLPSVADRIYAGGKFTVTFDVPSDNQCGIAWDAPGNLLGSVRGADGAYTGYYVPATKSWFFNGPVQDYANCGLRPAPFEDKGSTSDPRLNQLMIWGRQFNFDEQRAVWDNNMDRFSPGGTTAPIGRSGTARWSYLI